MTHLAPNALRDRISAAQTVEHRACNHARGIGLQRTAAHRIEVVDGANQSDAPVADQIVEIGPGNETAYATRDLAHERKVCTNRLIAIAFGDVFIHRGSTSGNFSAR